MSVRQRIVLVLNLAAFVAIVVAFVIVNGRANRTETLIEARYAECVQSIPILARINLFVEGAENVADVLLTNSLAMHAIAEPGTPVYRQQIVNIARLRASIDAGSGLRLPVPTEAVCRARRDAAL